MWPRCGRAVIGLLRGRRRRRRSRELADGAVFHAQASAPSASSCSARCATSPSRSALTGGSRQTWSRSSAPQPEAGLEGRCSLVEGEGACPPRVGAPTRCRGAFRRTRASSTATTRPGTRTRSKAASPLPAGRHTAAPSVSGLPSAPSRRPRLEARPDLGQTSARPSQTSAVSPTGLAKKLGDELPAGVVVLHNQPHGFNADPRFKLLQVVEVATSWNTRHPLIVHMTQPASSAARAALKGEL
jgi:hypothetical protein